VGQSKKMLKLGAATRRLARGALNQQPNESGEYAPDRFHLDYAEPDYAIFDTSGVTEENWKDLYRRIVRQEEGGTSKEYRHATYTKERPVYKAYNDSVGKLTGGVGHLLHGKTRTTLNAEGEEVDWIDPATGKSRKWQVGDPVSQELSEKWLEEDLPTFSAAAKDVLSKHWDDLPGEARAAFSAMFFQLGKAKIKKKFVKTLKAYNEDDLDLRKVVANLADSKWAAEDSTNRFLRFVDYLGVDTDGEEVGYPSTAFLDEDSPMPQNNLTQLGQLIAQQRREKPPSIFDDMGNFISTGEDNLNDFLRELTGTYNRPPQQYPTSLAQYAAGIQGQKPSFDPISSLLDAIESTSSGPFMVGGTSLDELRGTGAFTPMTEMPTNRAMFEPLIRNENPALDSVSSDSPLGKFSMSLELPSPSTMEQAKAIGDSLPMIRDPEAPERMVKTVSDFANAVLDPYSSFDLEMNRPFEDGPSAKSSHSEGEASALQSVFGNVVQQAQNNDSPAYGIDTQSSAGPMPYLDTTLSALKEVLGLPVRVGLNLIDSTLLQPLQDVMGHPLSQARANHQAQLARIPGEVRNSQIKANAILEMMSPEQQAEFEQTLYRAVGATEPQPSVAVGQGGAARPIGSWLEQNFPQAYEAYVGSGVSEADEYTNALQNAFAKANQYGIDPNLIQGLLAKQGLANEARQTQQNNQNEQQIEMLKFMLGAEKSAAETAKLEAETENIANMRSLAERRQKTDELELAYEIVNRPAPGKEQTKLVARGLLDQIIDAQAKGEGVTPELAGAANAALKALGSDITIDPGSKSSWHSKFDTPPSFTFGPQSPTTQFENAARR
jgi:GH24 family phage-related lysozyme (muramidase)